MSFEATVAQLVAQTNQALVLPQQIADLAAAKIADIGSTYQNRINSMRLTIYINQITGDDNGDGTAAHPKKTITAAISATPRGATLQIYLQADYAWSNPISLDGRNVLISSSGARYKLLPTATIKVANSISYRSMGAFTCASGGTLTLTDVDLIIPSAVIGSESYPVYGEGIFLQGWGTGAAVLIIGNANITMPTNPASTLFGAWDLINFSTWAVVVTGSLLGKLISGVTNSSGTAATSLPYLSTNLTTV